MDYLEILSFCAYDLDKARKQVMNICQTSKSVISEILEEVGLEHVGKVESKSGQRESK